ncbi:MAG TPA: hypothetical protein DCG75_13670 [Bacteroidales bacterium]|nr:hypothetical protein [Bacteroidales bacterium]
MNRESVNMRIPDWVILYTIASTTLYMISRNLPLGSGSFAFVWAPITLVFIFSLRPKTFIKGPMKNLLIYGMLMVGILQYTLWQNMNDWNQIRILYEFYYLVIMTAILYYYWGKGELRRLALLSKWTFVFIIITLITTNIALYLDPNLVREAARTGMFSDYQENIYKYTGAMGYGYIQAVILLIPILVYHIKRKKRMVFSPKVLIAILILILITEIRAQVFANVLVTALITILSVLGSKKRRVSFVTISLVGILFTVIPNTFYSNLFYSLSSNFNTESEMYYKLTDFAKFIENPDLDTSTGAGGRAERYPLLLGALQANPIFGHASGTSSLNIDLGAHLYWMNRLALWGIPGFLFFLFVLFKIFKSIGSLFDDGYRFYYFLSVVAFIIMGLSKAIGGTEVWLMLIVFIPGLYFLPLLQPTRRVKPIQKEIEAN